MKKLKSVPKLKSTIEEDRFWQDKDSSDYIDWSLAKRAGLPNLKPSTRSISLRLPEALLNEIKILANKEDVPYQSLIKILLAKGVNALRK